MPAEELNPQPAQEQKKPDTQNPPLEQKPAELKPAEQEKAKAEAAPKAQEQTNCLICNKPIKKLTRFYRDGKFYCSKKCWRTAKEKAKKEKETAKK